MRLFRIVYLAFRVSIFIAGALAGAAAALGAAVFGERSSLWTKQPERKDAAVGPAYRHLSEPHSTQDQASGLEDALEDEILSEQFTRNVQIFGREGQQRVHHAFVVVVGLGGVGSHAAHMLLRAGIGRLRIVDFDQVSLSSLNRHAVATRADVGLPKAKVLKEHFAQIVPEAHVDARVAMYTAEDEEALLQGEPDFVVDAIDDINTKVALLSACKSRGLPVLCACGAGAKADPSRVRIADISEASCDPLARKVRHLLRTRHNIASGIPMVISAEKPRCPLIPVEQLSHAPQDLQIVPNFRIRTVPVLGTTPAIFGMAAASWVLCELAQKPYIPEPIFYIKETDYVTLLDRLCTREELVFDNSEGVSLDLEDISFLARDVWRAKSARALEAAEEKGLSRSAKNLHFTRWDARKGPTVDNLLLLTGPEAEQHEESTLEEIKASEPEFVAKVEGVLAQVRTAFGLDPAMEDAQKNPLYNRSLRATAVRWADQTIQDGRSNPLYDGSLRPTVRGNPLHVGNSVPRTNTNPLYDRSLRAM